MTMCETYTWCTSRESNQGLNDGNSNNVNNNVQWHWGSFNRNSNVTSNVSGNVNSNVTINGLATPIATAVTKVVTTSLSTALATAVATGRSFMYRWVCGVGGRGVVVLEEGVGELVEYERYPRVESGTLGHYLIGFQGGRRNSPS